MLTQTETSVECYSPEVPKLPHRQATRIAVKNKRGFFIINPNDVLTVVAQRNYVLLQHQGGSHLLRESISALAEKFEPYGFIRIHRSMLVNRFWVEEIHPYPTGEYRLCLKGGKQFTVTRTYKKNLHALAELWLGSGPRSM